MNPTGTSVEAKMQRVANRWKMLRLLQHSATIGGSVCLIVILLGIALVRGWFDNTALVTTLIFLLAFATVLAWLFVVIKIAVKTAWIANGSPACSKAPIPACSTA